MAKFKNLNPTGVTVGRRHGGRLFFNKGQVIEVEDAEWIERLEARGDFQKIEEVVEHKTGAGVKTHIKTPKRRGRPPKSKAKPKTKIQEKVDKAIKEPKPKGLKKAKKEKAD